MPAIGVGLGGTAYGRGTRNPIIVGEAVLYQAGCGSDKFNEEAFDNVRKLMKEVFGLEDDLRVNNSCVLCSMQGGAIGELGELGGVDTPSIGVGLGGAPSGRCVLNPMFVVEACSNRSFAAATRSMGIPSWLELGRQPQHGADVPG
eukprot:2501360-Alexandrium_andersonii.AAC.1